MINYHEGSFFQRRMLVFEVTKLLHFCLSTLIQSQTCWVDHLHNVLHTTDQYECIFVLHQHQSTPLLMHPLTLNMHHLSITPMSVNIFLKLDTVNNKKKLINMTYIHVLLNLMGDQHHSNQGFFFH